MNPKEPTQNEDFEAYEFETINPAEFPTFEFEHHEFETTHFPKQSTMEFEAYEFENWPLPIEPKRENK